MKNVVIIGSSGHASVVLDCIEKEGKYRVVGFIDSFKKKGLSHNGYPVLGTEYDLPYVMSAYNVDDGIIAIGDNWSRRLILDRIKAIAPSMNFIKVIHPNAVIGNRTKIGRGSVVMPGVIINSGSIIGDFCFINTSASLGHDSIMGDFSSIAPQAGVGGNLILGSYSAICLGARIIENIEIGAHTVVGAGAIVLDHVESMVVSYGSPSKVVRTREVGEAYLGRASHTSSVLREPIK